MPHPNTAQHFDLLAESRRRRESVRELDSRIRFGQMAIEEGPSRCLDRMMRNLGMTAAEVDECIALCLAESRGELATMRPLTLEEARIILEQSHRAACRRRKA